MIESIAIGSFDGVHIAHRELIKRADSVAVIERGFGTITPGWTRSLYTKKATFFYMFDKVKSLTPKEFVAKLKSDFPALKKIVVGYDFVYGKDRSGTIDSLRADFDGEVEVVDEVKLHGISVHSRVIRELLKNSKIEQANSMLGRCYRICGKAVKGQGIGAKELVATINLKVLQYSLPHGVFATKTILDGVEYKSVSFIGHRQSTDGNFAVETHILNDFNGVVEDGQEVWIEFISFIRENQKFNSLDELKEQIFKDIDIAQNFLLE